jgi:release factor glutamine methyltransferase
VSLKSLDNYLRDFFNRDKKELARFYPGITLHRLKQDLAVIAEKLGLDEDFDQDAYLESPTNPFTIFFEQLKKGVPLEYITGVAFFYRSSFKVTPDVLIPRSETEILVELAAQELQNNYRNKECRVIDIGTGSGAIIISLLCEETPIIKAIASDISEKALNVAKINFFNQRYLIPNKHSLDFVKSDRLNEVEGRFDMILSNPPYIKKTVDFNQVHHQVSRFEPHLALFLEDTVYEQWFKDFFISIYEKLADSGVSLIEGHEDHLEQLAQLAHAVGFKQVAVIKDYTNRNRFLKLNKT